MYKGTPIKLITSYTIKLITSYQKQGRPEAVGQPIQNVRVQ